MTTKFSQLKKSVVTLAIALAATAGALNAQVCSIGTNTYATLDLALAAVPANGATPTVIKLLADITHDGGCTITDKKITFDRNGKNLVFNGTTTHGLTLINSNIGYIGTGAINVSATAGYNGLNISGGYCNINYAETKASGSYAVFCAQGGVVRIAGNVSAAVASGGICADGAGSAITVSGNITSGGNGAAATNGGSVSVYGNITAVNDGIHAGNGAGASVTVAGNVTMTGNGSGIYSNGNYQINVFGSVSASGSGQWAVLAEAGTIQVGSVINSSNGIMAKNLATTVTVNGSIATTGVYIQINGINKMQSQNTTPTTKDGYFTYNDVMTQVWVKDPNAFVCRIGTINYTTLDAALTAVPVNTPTNILLLQDITHNGGCRIDNKKISFILNGKNLTFTDAGSTSYAALEVYGCVIDYGNNAGAFNVISYTKDALKVVNSVITLKYVELKSIYGKSAVYGENSPSGSTITVNGDVVCEYGGSRGILVQSGFTVYVTGNVTFPASSIGNIVGVATEAASTVTVDGVIAAPIYIQISGSNYTQTDYTIPSTKPNYITYSDGSSTVWVKGNSTPVCQIGTKGYITLDDALSKVPELTQTSILLLQDITHEDGCSISNKKITFDLNGKNLIFSGTTTPGLTLSNSVIDYVRAGNFKAISSGNNGLSISGGYCYLTYAETSNSAGGKNAIYCNNGGFVVVSGNVTTTYDNSGVTADGANSTVKVFGDVNAGGKGLSAFAGGTVEVTGNVTANFHAIDSNSGLSVSVTGNVTSTYNSAIYSIGNGDVHINVTGIAATANIGGAWGIWAEVGTIKVGSINAKNGVMVSNTGTNATVDGTITAINIYIQLNGVNKTKADGVPDAAMPDYLKYTDNTSTVWVKNSGTAVETITADQLRIYPNPVKDELFINLLSFENLTGLNVEIFDLSGRAVGAGLAPAQMQNAQRAGLAPAQNGGQSQGQSSGQPQGLPLQINVTDLASGVYLLKIQADKGMVTKKFIKE